MKRLSIIIVTYNSERDIYDCLESIRRHTDIAPEELEIIIVDNNSRQADAMFSEIHHRFGPDIILLRNPRNGGYGQGNNLGIRQASSPVVLIMNPDVRLMEPLFQTVLQAFDADSRLSMYGIKQMLSPGEPSTNSIACSYTLNGYLATILTAWANRTDRYLPRLMYFSGSCFFIRKQMFKEIGLFDEELFMYGEEDDIHYRMKQRYGCHMTYNPHLHYIHLTKERQPDPEYEKRVFRSLSRMLSKKGYSEKTVTLNHLRRLRLQILRLRLLTLFGRGNPTLLFMLQDFRKYLNDRYHCQSSSSPS